jgi:hypothetical protein
VRVLIVGDGPETPSLLATLRNSDLEVDHRGDAPPPADGPQEVAEIARDLREFEGALGADGMDAVVVTSDSGASLAAVLVATKLGTPVARLGSTGDAANASANARLIRQLADIGLAADPATILDWMRDGYPAQA